MQLNPGIQVGYARKQPLSISLHQVNIPRSPKLPKSLRRGIYRTNLYGKLGRESIHPMTKKKSRKLLLCHNQLQKSVIMKQI
jgi:hypothetical protein